MGIGFGPISLSDYHLVRVGCHAVVSTGVQKEGGKEGVRPPLSSICVYNAHVCGCGGALSFPSSRQSSIVCLSDRLTDRHFGAFDFDFDFE